MNALARWNHSRWKQLNELEDLRESLRILSSRSCARRPEQRLGPPQRIPVVHATQEDGKIMPRSGALFAQVGAWHHGGLNE